MVGVETARVATTARGVDGANANVDEAKRQMAAMMAMILFMFVLVLAVGVVVGSILLVRSRNKK